jgi:choline dehydrogenase-like flavoprotein
MDQSFDAVIIGSGFGGALTAHALVDAGWSVLMLERGAWVERGPAASRPENFAVVSPHYSRETGYRVQQDKSSGSQPLGALFCVGGASVFYGGVSLRLREHDFHPSPEITADSGAEWPFEYAELEPYYAEAERIIGVSGVAEGDPTAPWRSGPYLSAPPPRTVLSDRLARAATRLGLHPFALPMAIHHGGEQGRAVCVRCGACDGFACPVSAKNDLTTRVITPLVERGMKLLTGTAAVRLVEQYRRITGIECVERATGKRFTVRGREVVLAAGALATPHLLLASGLARLNPGGAVIGRYLMRHVNSGVYGLELRRSPPDGLVKEIAIHDYYDGDGRGDPPGPLGAIQSWQTPPPGIARIQLSAPLAWLADRITLPRSAGLLAITEDQPQRANGVTLEPARQDGVGLPALRIEHHYSARDRAAHRALCRHARRILREAGAIPYVRLPMRTFSHALGTVRMGRDERSSALDRWCRFRGVENLRVADASALPTAGAVNPSLTIAANALRLAAALVTATDAASAASQEHA